MLTTSIYQNIIPLKTNNKAHWQTGLYYYGARYYKPRISTFISVDPLAEHTMTPYQYTYQNPIYFIDPDGRWPWPTKNDPWVKGAGFFRNIFKNSARIHAENYAKNVNGNVVEGGGWGYHVFYSSFEEGGHWQNKANFKKGSNNTKPNSIESYGDLDYSLSGDALIMGNVLDIPIDLVTMAIVQGSETLGMSEDNSMILAGVLIVINDVKGLKVNKIIRNADDLIQAANKTAKQPRNTSTINKEVTGNIDDIFNTITKGGSKNPKTGSVTMPDGTIINRHISTKGNGGTIDVNKGGEINKIRVNTE